METLSHFWIVNHIRKTTREVGALLRQQNLSENRGKQARRSPEMLGSMSDVRAELARLRNDCHYADLMMEQCQRLHDEIERHISKHGYDEIEIDLADEYVEKFSKALEELLDIEFEDVPAQLRFADSGILTEIQATRQNLDDAIVKCQTMLSQMSRIASKREAVEKVSLWPKDMLENPEVIAEFERLIMSSRAATSDIGSDVTEDIASASSSSKPSAGEVAAGRTAAARDEHVLPTGPPRFASPLHATLGLVSFDQPGADSIGNDPPEDMD
jgi:hypothetical protein